MSEPTRYLTCAVCGERIGVQAQFLHFRWAGTGGLVEIVFHHSCHEALTTEEFEALVGERVDEALASEPEVFESKVELYDPEDGRDLPLELRDIIRPSGS